MVDLSSGAPESSVPVNTTTGLSATTVEPEKSPGAPSDSRLKTSNGPRVTVTSPSFASAGNALPPVTVGVEVRTCTVVPDSTPTIVMYARLMGRPAIAM